MEFMVGDVVEYDKGDGTTSLAHVDAVFNNKYSFNSYSSHNDLVISFLDPNLFPQTMTVPEYRCKLWNRLGERSKCECGAHKVYKGTMNIIYHATWCPIVPKGSYGKQN